MDKKFVLRASSGREYPITGFTRVGRNADCMIRFTDPAVSGHHASVWIVQDGLWLSDNNSTNGVFVNGQQIPPDQSYPLHMGDRIHLGDSHIEMEVLGGPPRPVTASAKPTSSPTRPPTRPAQTTPTPSKPARRLAPIACVTMLGCMLIAGLLTLSSYFFLGSNITNLLPGQTRVLAVSTPQSLLKPQEYATSSQTLAQAVAQLNQSQLAFIRAAKSVTGSLPKVPLARLAFPIYAADSLDQPLRQVAADAFNVAKTASSLNQTMAAQDSGSQQAGQMAAQYGSVAKLGAALVIEVQDLREELARGSITHETASNVIAEYGARLWNPSVNDPANPGNPFTTYLSDPSIIPVAQLLSDSASAQLSDQLDGELSTWVAVSDTEVTKKFTVPDGILLDEAILLAAMLTEEGQQDGDTSKQAAAAIIKQGGTKPSDAQVEGEIVATFASAITVGASDKPETTPSRNVMTFPKGPVTIVSESPSDDVISGLVSLDGNSPSIVAQIPVQDTKPLVNIQISNISITTINKKSKDDFNSFEADVAYEFDVKWTSNVAAPKFELDCVGSNHFAISTTSGTQRIRAKGLLILYPGAETAYCYASNNGNTWGSASTRFLVGDVAGATQRAIQVETDSASLDLTLASDAVNTLAAQNTRAASTLTSIAIENAVSTEVYGTRTAEFIATITEIARQTRDAPTPADTETPLPTATFTPVLVETFYHPGDVHAVAGRVSLKQGRLYRVCLSGVAYITTGPVYASDIEYVNGIKVPLSGCVVIEGNGAVARVSCSKGEPAEEPGGFTIQVYDLGPH